MGKLTNVKRLIKEDFDQKYYDLIERIAYSLNPLIDQLVESFDKGLTIENLSREISTFRIENDTAGKLKIPVQVKTILAGVKGITVINAVNVTNPATDPLATPWITWSLSKGQITIKKVIGIQADNKYDLTVEIIN